MVGTDTQHTYTSAPTHQSKQAQWALLVLSTGHIMLIGGDGLSKAPEQLEKSSGQIRPFGCVASVRACGVDQSLPLYALRVLTYIYYMYH